MDYSLLLLLIALIRVQGYHNDTNGTSSENYVYTSLDSHQKQFKIKDFDNVFRHYRSDNKRRESRFISFQTKDDNIEVEIDFAIPFLSIPVKRSLSGAMGTLQNVIKVSVSSRYVIISVIKSAHFRESLWRTSIWVLYS